MCHLGFVYKYIVYNQKYVKRKKKYLKIEVFSHWFRCITDVKAIPYTLIKVVIRLTKVKSEACYFDYKPT